jgi:very-short-patch-repair endonuclease
MGFLQQTLRFVRLSWYAWNMRRKPTNAEAFMRARLAEESRNAWRLQVVIHNRFIVDFYCASGRVAIEVDGPYHGTRAHLDRQRDRILARECAIFTYRIPNHEVYDRARRLHHIRNIDRYCDHFNRSYGRAGREAHTSGVRPLVR